MLQHATSDAAMPAKHGQRSCSGAYSVSSPSPATSSATSRNLRAWSSRLRLDAFPRCRRPLNSVDDLVTRHRVGEVGYDMSLIPDVCSERGVDTADVVGGRALEVGELGPFLCQRRRDSQLGRLVALLRSGDSQGKYAGEWS